MTCTQQLRVASDPRLAFRPLHPTTYSSAPIPLLASLSGPDANHLLAAMPMPAFDSWFPHLEPVDLQLGQVLCESGRTMAHAYFPTTSVVSLMYVTRAGESSELAMVGNEGLVGVSLFLGGDSTPSRAVVASAGRGYRLNAVALQDEFNAGGAVMHLLLRYAQALMTQMGQTAVCNRHHSLNQWLCRWLLMSLDRLPGHELLMTQELISNMLGVRREGVTEAALSLQKAGLISYARGHITVLDRAGLEGRACECYSAIRSEYARLLPDRAANLGTAPRSWTGHGAGLAGHSASPALCRSAAP